MFGRGAGLCLAMDLGHEASGARRTWLQAVGRSCEPAELALGTV